MFWKKKKKPKKTMRLKHIPLPILIRQTIYDSMLEPAEGIAVAMGLPPISEEVSEMETKASQDRLERFSSLIPFIDSHSDIASRIAIASYILDEDGEEKEDLDEEEIARLSGLFKLVALSSSMSCVSTLFNLGFIESKVVEDDVE